MPQIKAQGQIFTCEPGANLRQVLLKQGIALHNDRSQWINCRGIGTCGTCAVQIVAAGAVPLEMAVSAPQWRETTRRSLPPHSLTQDRRLACQTQVYGDIEVTKYDGFWGQGEQVRWLPQS
ncbi:MAG: (2Fe-2S)-binding protein [Elainella sp. Prado103]|jgi:ferredoxin|nr:(2Fe-2S)-binding protein [Elainella sp. Prado103]